MRLFVFKKSYFLIFLLFLVPPFFYVALNQSSNAAGVLFVSVFFVLYFTKMICGVTSYRFICVLLIVFMYCGVSFANGGDALKVAISWFMFFSLVIIHNSFLNEKYFYHDVVSVFTVKLFYFFLVFLGCISIEYKFTLWGYGDKTSNVFPFSEPSHYAIAYIFFAAVYQLYVCKNKGVHTFLVTLVLGVSFPNLTLIIVSFILLCLLNIRCKVIVSVVITIGALLFINTFYSEYFLSRLAFNDNERNLSNLVYLQGWESAWIALKETNGLGVGFQSLGIQSPGMYTELIRDIMGGYDLNRNDGGFLAAKFIGEFGILGVFVSILIFINVIKVVFSANALNYRCEPLPVIYMALSMVVFIEFFVRGFGYFSPGFILFSVFILCKPRFFNRKVLLT